MKKECIDNFVNGNHTEAKRLARCLSIMMIYNEMMNNGWLHEKAYVVSYYLKNNLDSLQQACDTLKCWPQGLT